MYSLTLLCDHGYFPTCGGTLLTCLMDQSWTVFDFSGATGEGFGVTFSILHFAKMCYDGLIITLFQMQPWPFLPAALSEGLSMLSIPAATQLWALTEDRWGYQPWGMVFCMVVHPSCPSPSRTSMVVASSLTGTQGPRASSGPHDPSLHGPGAFQL